MTRGRLILPFEASIAQLDTAATEAAGNYDTVWRTMKPSLTPGGERDTGRREKAPIRLRCQVEPSSHEAQAQGPGGDLARTSISLAFHFRDLEKLSLVDPVTGDPLLRKNDRLVAIYDKHGALVQTFAYPPGVFCVQSQPREYGLGSKRNILLMIFQDRPQGTR